jgi:threonine aldolase
MSDNTAAMCPAALEQLLAANGADHTESYGDDAWTKRACDKIRELFETDCEVFFVFTGSAANALALAHLCRPFDAVICHELAHATVDECGGPEFFSGGAKLLALPGADGKLEPAAVEQRILARFDLHFPKIRTLTLTQATELGTIYSVEEIRALTDVAKRHCLLVHMDGARFANAVAALDATPADVTWRAGVDVLTFGGTKNGLAVGEAVVFFDRTLAEDFDRRAKQAGQLASKMRFISAPWLGLLSNDVWRENARHANAMAERLRVGISSIRGVKVLVPRQANAVFVDVPLELHARLAEHGWHPHPFIGRTGLRVMCAWDTRPETVERFVADLATIVGNAGRS